MKWVIDIGLAVIVGILISAIGGLLKATFGHRIDHEIVNAVAVILLAMVLGIVAVLRIAYGRRRKGPCSPTNDVRTEETDER